MPRQINPAPQVEQAVSYPTPQLIDRHLLDLWSTKEADYEVMQPGTPHPDSRNFAGFFLLKEMPTSQTDPDWVYRIWVNSYSGQDFYNYETDYSAGSNDHPLYTRTYLELRSQQGVSWPLPKLQPLSGIFDARVGNGGSGYEQHSVTATVTGTGTGADILPIVTEGAVTHLIIRNPGTGYTGTPTVTFGGGGIGATAVLLIQPETCLLYTEEQVRADETNDWMYVKVRRTYETFPGPQIVHDAGYEDETGAKQYRTEQRVVIADTTVPGFGDQDVLLFVMDAKLPADPKNYLVGTLLVDWMENPADREEIRDGNYPVPDLFTPIPGYSTWPIPAAEAGCPQGPYQNRIDGLDYLGNPLPADVNYRGTYELQVSTPACPITDTFTYFIPPVAAPPTPFEVTSQPGKFLPVTRNTIHGALTEYFIGSGGNVVIENLRASTPATYTSGTTVIGASERQWKGPFYRRCVTTCEFPSLPNE